jgi:hypothetical protein
MSKPPSSSVLTYSHRPKPIGDAIVLRLDDEGLELHAFGQDAAMRFADMREVRLAYRPRNVSSHLFEVTVSNAGRRRLRYGNFVWKGLMDIERNDAAFSAFTRALLLRAHAANGAIVFMAGLPAWRYYPAAALGGATLLVMLGVAISALTSGSWPAALLAIGFGTIFGVWTWRYLTRNRPRAFTPDAPPMELLPS